jgi:hypothetical protein
LAFFRAAFLPAWASRSPLAGERRSGSLTPAAGRDGCVGVDAAATAGVAAARPRAASAGAIEASRRAAFSWLRLTPSSVPYSFWIFRSARRRIASGVMPPSGVRSRNWR